MPSTTTTTVTIGSILDLIGPTSSSTSNSDDQTGFDSLLQATAPPPNPLPPSPVPEPRPSPVADSRSDDRNHPPAENPVTNTEPIASGGNSEHDASQPTAAPTPPPAPSSGNKNQADHPDPEHAGDKSDDQLASEQIVAQSLAGLPTVPKSVPSPDAAASPKGNGGGLNDDADASTAQVANFAAQLKPTNQPAKASSTDTPTAVKTDAVGKTETPTVDPLKQVATTVVTNPGTHETIAKPQTADNVVAVKKVDDDQSPTDSLPQATDIKLIADDKPQNQSSQTKHDQSPATDTSQLTLDASAVAAISPDSTNPQTSAATPLIAPIANVLPSVNQSTSTPSNNSNPTVAINNSSPRPRLPAQALAPTSNASTRHAPTEVDVTRLISRVVRAFSAAQERDGEVRLRLSPPELGSLQLDVRIDNGTLTAHMQTETDSARQAIIDNLPTLRDRLAEQGVRIDRFDVDLMQRQSGGMPDQPGGRQPDMPEAPLRFPPSPQTTAATTAPIVDRSSPSLGNSSGLNVVI